MDPTFFARSAATLGFAHNGLDRLAARRDDAAFVADLLNSAEARVLVIAGDAIALRSGQNAETPWFGVDRLADFGPLRDMVFLGRDAEGPVFATLLAPPALAPPAQTSVPQAPSSQPAAPTGVQMVNLRALAVESRISPADLGACAEGKALLHWHGTHRFCANCGAPTKSGSAGWRRECAACGALHFPRTDPVVIMLCVDGDKCLLGRQPRFPPLMYSCLAGFLEPGETIEAAVRREIAEESGIVTGPVRYLGSQPWPFPASLMIGCVAEARSTAITIEDDELEDARWFSRAEVLAMFESRHPEGLVCPMPMAIAYHLVRAWVDAASP